MFEMSFVEGRARTHKGWTVIVSFALQAVLVLTALLVPMLRPGLLPASLTTRILFVAPPGPPPAPPPAAPVAAAARPAIRQLTAGQLLVPARIPDRPAMIVDDFEAYSAAHSGPYVPGGIPGGTGAPGAGLPFSIALAPAPPPPAAAAAPPAPAIRRIEVGGHVLAAKLILPAQQPVYPPLAKQTRTQGLVVLAALIGPDGRIRNLRVISGHPLLTQAALDAVRHWRYQPTLLNGDPVEVDTTVEVRFVLQ
ncbi:MAG: TonB family protein [Bryobacteraceae bacterium]|nr:TonB family protein [Bryobacteraceae bacterium]